MSKLIITRGLPASLHEQWVLEHRVRINDIRLMLGKYWVPKRGPLVQQALIEALLKGYDIVIDNTNLNKKVLDNYRALVMEIML